MSVSHTTPGLIEGHSVPIAVELKNITMTYGNACAVDDISLEICEGEFVTLLGPSGSGKTTILRIVAGMIQPKTGSVRISGRDVSSVPMYKRNIGMVFQNYSLFPHLTVAQNVAYPLRVRGLKVGDAQTAVDGALSMVRLDGYGDRKPEELSGGQQQRVALARALVFNPDVLLLDEPLSALDRVLREEMQLELRRIHQTTGATMVLVTHDRSEALTMSDRVIMLRDGKVVQADRPRDIYERSGSRFVAEFLGETNVLPMTLERVPGSAGARVFDDEGRELHIPEIPAEASEGPAELIVRVEAVQLAQRDNRGRNAWQGVIEEAVFLGDAMRYQVRCGIHSITARVGTNMLDQALSVGSDVDVVIDVRRAMVFPRSP